MSQFRVVDEVGADGDYRDNVARADSAITKEYGESNAGDTSARFERIEGLILTMAEKMDRMCDSRQSIQHRDMPVQPPYCSQPLRMPADDFIQQQLDRERYSIPAQDGKMFVPDMFVKNPIPKPYMFVDRLATSSIKKKFDYRPNITSAEYISAFIGMLCDERVRNPRDVADQLDHLHDVTLDAMSRNWPDVRRWSQHVFDMIETGKYQWSDTQKIQNARFRFSVSAHQVQTHNHNSQSHMSNDTATREVVCQDFNARSCSHGAVRRHHTEGQVRFMHYCSYCLASANIKSDNHPLSDCKRKERHAAAHTSAAYTGPPQPTQPVYQHPNAQSRPRPLPQATMGAPIQSAPPKNL